jgi:hypothetical protein
MRERELASLLIQMGVDNGTEIEKIANDLAGLSLPSFVNPRAFRGALLEAVEDQMRAQMEQRLQAMRQKFDVAEARTPTTSGRFPDSSPHIASHTPATTGGPRPLERQPDSEITMLETIVDDMPDDEGTSDDTIVWSPRRD